MEHQNQIATVQALPDRLRLYCPELMNELQTIKTWTGKKIADYDTESFIKELKKSLAEIILITGGKMYDETKEPKMYKGQLNSINKLLIYSFSFLSFQEIVNAFYLNSAGKMGDTISHYGRELNVDFIGNVLAEYKKYKQGLFNQHGIDLVKVVKGELPPPPTVVLTDEDFMNDKRRDIENAYQRLVNNLEMDEGLFPEYFYDVLEADGAIKTGLYENKLAEAKQRLAKAAQIDTMWKTEKEKMRNNGSAILDETDDGRGRYEDTGHIGEHLKKLRWLAKEGLLNKHQPAVTMSKQIIVKEFFLLCFKNGDKNIYGVGIETEF